MTDTKIRGFTIVELLIVIVIIGILAVIAVITYGGIQQRARSALWLSRADQWEKFLRQEAVLSSTGKLPRSSSSQYRCLGRSIDEFPAEGAFQQGECVVAVSDDNTSRNTYGLIYSQSFMDQFQSGAKPPAGKLPTFNIRAYGGNYYVRGLYLWIPSQSDSRPPQLEWDSNIADDCGRGVSLDSGTNPFYDYCVVYLQGI